MLQKGDDVVSLDEDRLPVQGTVRWIGKMNPTTVVGIQCALRIGSNDGTFKGQRFFSCEDGFGEFIPVKHVMKKEQYIKVFGSPELKVDPKQQLVRVHLYIDDGTRSAGPLPYTVDKDATLMDLKMQLHERYKPIEPDKQEWIIGGQVRSDDGQKLTQFVKLITGLPLYLNILHGAKHSTIRWRACVKCYALIVEEDACKKCGYLDSSSVDTIEIGEENEMLDEPELWPECKWPCVSCTYVNSGRLPVCRSCKANKPQQKSENGKAESAGTKAVTSESPSTQATPGKWVCYRCTCVNPFHAEMCVGCKLDRPEMRVRKRKSSDTEEPPNKKTRSEQGEQLLQKSYSMKWMCPSCFGKTEEEMCNECKKLLQEIKDNEKGWECTNCNMINIAARPGCQVCAEPRPDTFVVPQEEVIEWERKGQEREKAFMKRTEEEQQKHLQWMLHIQQQPVNQPLENFLCKICFDDILLQDGILLKSCLHSFCKGCLTGYIESHEEAEIKCPYVEGETSCKEIIQEREIRALVSEEAYKRWQAISLGKAESTMEDSFHCKTLNCIGWCAYEDGVNTFDCPVCRHENCINCQAIHEGQDCRQYQNGLDTESRTSIEARQTKEGLERMLRNSEAMRCPKCKTIVIKQGGCDALLCRVCKTELCWATKGPRWGPGGHGDRSGGCHCQEGGRMCHPRCSGCH